MAKAKFYITTAIDYVNRTPHLGTAWEKIAADVIARYQRLAGHEVFFLMGNDEHSLNVERRARELGLDPLTYCDQMEEEFRARWRALHISFDDFIRTTAPRHEAAVREILTRLNQRGVLYRGTYAGWYCDSCEAFWAEKELEGGECPLHRVAPRWLEEENYFLGLAGFRNRLLAHIQAHPELILPETRRNEIVSFLEAGLEDVSVSRASTRWGIPLPFDPRSVVYVWVDALINYLTGVGFPEDEARFQRWWPADLHVIGKDITRFHCIVWPAILMTAGLPLPGTVYGHGFLTLNGVRMSKSLGTDLDPLEAVQLLGADPLRYFLVREVPFDKDGDFSWERYVQRYNADLANGLGNLVSRTVTMLRRYRQGRVPRPTSTEDGEPLIRLGHEATRTYQVAMEAYELHRAVAALWVLVAAANSYIEERAPWHLARDPGAAGRLDSVLAWLMETIRHLILLLSPILPAKCAELWRQLGFSPTLEEAGWAAIEDWEGVPPQLPLAEVPPPFPRLTAAPHGS